MRRTMLVLIVLAAVLLVPQAASANAPSTGKTSFGVKVFLPKRHGYSFGLAAAGGHVGISVSKGKPLDGELNTYTAKGTATEDAIKANFGKFGTVNLLWHQTGMKSGKPGARCKECALRTLYGFYTGEVRFRGENGFIVLG